MSRLSGERGQIELVLLLLLAVELVIKSGGGSGLVEHHHEVDGGRVRVVALREVVGRSARARRTQAGRGELQDEVLRRRRVENGRARWSTRARRSVPTASTAT